MLRPLPMLAFLLLAGMGCEQTYIPTFDDTDITCTLSDNRESWRFSAWVTDADGLDTIQQVRINIQDLDGQPVFNSELELDEEDPEHWSVLRAATEVEVTCAQGHLYLFHFEAEDTSGQVGSFDATYP